MLNVFVCIPPKYFMTKEESKSHRERLEQLALQTAISLNEFVDLLEDMEFLQTEKDDDIDYCKLRYIRDCICILTNADYAVFADNWQTSEECRIIHAIAEFCDIKILEL